MKTLGRYELVRLIGQGGMGSVYEARDPRIGRRVAIKAISLAAAEDAERVRERLKREAGLAAILKHPNIVAVYDFDEFEDTAFIVMEYLTGHTLESLLRETNPYAWRDFVPLLVPCAAALDYAHGLGVVHLDMKPSNIKVQDDGVPKILDFGLARLAYHSQHTAKGVNLTGTISYLAPEVIRGEASEPAADQFTLGVILYRLLTGTFPFVADSTAGMLQSILYQSPKPMEELVAKIPLAVRDAIDKSLLKDPAGRFNSCSELLQAVYPPMIAAGLLDTSRYRDKAGLVTFGPGVAVIFPGLEVAAQRPADNPSIELESLRPTAACGVELRRLPSPTGRSLSRRVRDAFSRFKQWCRFILNKIGVLNEQRLKIEYRDLEEQSDPRPGERRVKAEIPEAPPQPPEFSYTPGEQTMILRKPPDQRLAPEELAAYQTSELISLAEHEDFERALALEGKWLPGPEGAEPPLLAFREAARYLMAAKNASSAHNIVDHLTRAEAVLMTAGNQLYRNRSPLAVELPKALEVWKRLTRERLQAARLRMDLELPNPFRAGQPLRPDQGRPVFRGREEIVRQIETILADASQSGSIALLGPRRCGKTSLLQMLPALLPDCLCIFFDLQDNPVDSTHSFFTALHDQAQHQAFRDRRVTLPSLPSGDVFASAMRWFQALDSMEGDVRILLCVDEFERIEDLFPGSRQDLLRLMGLFRATIQHRKKLRLLVSGVAPFDELGEIWNDHFINVRQLRVGHLDRPTALDLLMRPVPEFPPNAIPERVAAAIYDRTSGQPYLLQLYGSLLISHLNGAKRKFATIEDVNPIEEEAMIQGTHYFRHTYESAPEGVRVVLEQLATGQAPAMTPIVQRWLIRRGLINDERTLCMPVLGVFIREELGLR